MGDATNKPSPGDTMLRVIGVVKLIKAALFVALGLALVKVLGSDALQERIIHWVDQLRPGKLTHLVDALLRKVLALPINKRVIFEGGAFAYAAIFTVEGVGLILRKRWAEWLTVVGTGLLVPFEAYEVFHHPDIVRITALVVNLAIVAYLITRIQRDRAKE